MTDNLRFQAANKVEDDEPHLLMKDARAGRRREHRSKGGSPGIIAARAEHSALGRLLRIIQKFQTHTPLNTQESPSRLNEIQKKGAPPATTMHLTIQEVHLGAD